MLKRGKWSLCVLHRAPGIPPPPHSPSRRAAGLDAVLGVSTQTSGWTSHTKTRIAFIFPAACQRRNFFDPLGQLTAYAGRRERVVRPAWCTATVEMVHAVQCRQVPVTVTVRMLRRKFRKVRVSVPTRKPPLSFHRSLLWSLGGREHEDDERGDGPL